MSAVRERPTQLGSKTRTQWRCAISFISSLFGGASPELNTLIGQFSQVGGNQVSQGQKYSSKAGDFFSDIVSGDTGKIMQSISPAVDAAKTSTAQDQKTATMFGPRSGGTAAANAASADKTHGYIANLIGSLTGSSADKLANLGTTMTSTGLESLSQEQGAVQQRIQNWNDSIAGKGITTAVAAGEAYALGA